MIKSKVLTVILIFGTITVLGKSGEQLQNEPVKIKSDHFENLYQINEEIYRSEQPSKDGMKELERLGIKTVLNFRNRMSDKREAKGTDLELIRLRINTWKMAYQDIVNGLILMEKAKKPIVIHCLHGSDRTGILIACYRLIHDKWNKEAALEEFRDERFGYHDGWFPRLPQLIHDLNISELKRDIQSKIEKK